MATLQRAGLSPLGLSSNTLICLRFPVASLVLPQEASSPNSAPPSFWPNPGKTLVEVAVEEAWLRGNWGHFQLNE